LLSAHLPGDGWRLQHDTIKKFLVRAALDHRALAREEIYGLFSHVFDSIRSRAPLQNWQQVPTGVRHAAVPDIGIALDGGCEKLYELKTMTPCPSRYCECSRGGASRPAFASPCTCAQCTRGNAKAVHARAKDVPARLRRRLERLAVQLGGEEQDLVGRLDELGGVEPLVVGAYGGVSEGLRDLLTALAASAAKYKWNDLLAPSVSHCAGVLRVQMQRDLCFTLARARSRLLRDRLAGLRRGFGPTHAPGGSGPDWERREQTRFRAGRPAANAPGGAARPRCF
jgi:hypothetical protein